MIRLISLLILVLSVSACATTNPASSDCFRHGKASCTFTLLPELWGQ
ncbi:hypothetical protein [Martelella alba]|nr:hypothetical protein [Martelella alba]